MSVKYGPEGLLPETSSRLPNTPKPAFGEATACLERNDIRHPASFPPLLRGLRELTVSPGRCGWTCMCVHTRARVCVYVCVRLHKCALCVCFLCVCVYVSAHSMARGESSKCWASTKNQPKKVLAKMAPFSRPAFAQARRRALRTQSLSELIKW